MDLSHNEGECDVTVRAWGTEDDWLVIQGVSILLPTAPSASRRVASLRLPSPSRPAQKKEQLTFYSNNYRTFLIDYIKVTQKVKAGDKGGSGDQLSHHRQQHHKVDVYGIVRTSDQAMTSTTV